MCYFGSLLQWPEVTAAAIAHALKDPRLGRVDCLVGIGLSGTMALPGVKEKTGIAIMPHRKDKVESHGGQWTIVPVLEAEDHVRYVIVDDFVCTGGTVKNLVKRMKAHWPNWELAGLIFYEQEASGRMATALPGVPELALGIDVVEAAKLRGRGYELCV